MSGAEIFLVASLVSAGVKYQQSKEDARYLDQKGREADNQAYAVEIKGRQDALNYKRQGIEALKQMEKVMSANIARAFSGNINPFTSGETGDLIQTYSLRAGLNDWSITRDNASMVMKNAQYQASEYRHQATEYRRSASKVRQFAKINLVTDVAMASVGYSQIGSAPTTATTNNKFLDPSFIDFGTTGTRQQFMTPRTGSRYMPSYS